VASRGSGDWQRRNPRFNEQSVSLESSAGSGEGENKDAAKTLELVVRSTFLVANSWLLSWAYDSTKRSALSANDKESGN
jgi:hypothetical protein